MPARWLVVDMDEGVLRSERRLRDAEEWARNMADAPLRERHRNAASYEVIFGDTDVTLVSFTFVRADRAHILGFDPHQTPLYPHESDPYEEVARPKEK